MFRFRVRVIVIYLLMHHQIQYVMEAVECENQILQKENRQLKKELEKQKSRYNKLKELYVASVKKTIEAELKLKEFNIMSKIATNFAAYFNQASSEDEDIDLKEPTSQNIENSKVVSYFPTENSYSQRLFQQFVIIQPNITTKEFQTSYIYPNQNFQQLQQTRKRLLTFVFPEGVSFKQTLDDTEESRKNQIIFGSQGELLEFVLQNDNEEKANRVMESINRKTKFYCYVYVKPHIMMGHSKYLSSTSSTKKFFQSERAFIFVSKFPFRQFFNDLNKSIQQTVKLLHLSDKPIDSIRKDYNKIYEAKIHNFPIQKSWKTQISEVKLSIQSQEKLLMDERKHYFLCIVNQLPPAVISRIMHYALIQCHLLLLNNTLGFIKSMLYPLMWQFSTIYSLNNQLLPFLQVPFPIIIGVNKNRDQLRNLNWGLQSFVMLDIEQAAFINDEKVEKIVAHSWRKLAIDLNKQKVLGMLHVIQQFVQGLIRSCKEGGDMNRESQFHREVMQTQMMTTYLERFVSGKSRLE